MPSTVITNLPWPASMKLWATATGLSRRPFHPGQMFLRTGVSVWTRGSVCKWSAQRRIIVYDLAGPVWNGESVSVRALPSDCTPGCSAPIPHSEAVKPKPVWNQYQLCHNGTLTLEFLKATVCKWLKSVFNTSMIYRALEMRSVQFNCLFVFFNVLKKVGLS